MIIGFSGRKGSGKTELAKICEEYGFKKLSMAHPLKEMASHILHFNIDELQSTKEKIISWVPSKEDILFISRKTGIEEKFINESLKDVKIETVRDFLQYIGTNVIRKYNTDWHVNELKKFIHDKSINYVFDDIRFRNEKNFIEENGGTTWFVVRPIIDNISNHESETSLSWRNFGTNVIINNIPLNSLRKKFKRSIETFFHKEKFVHSFLGCNYSNELRNKLCNLLKEKSLIEIAKEYNIEESILIMYINNLMIPYPYLYDKSLNAKERFDYSENKTLKILKNELTVKENGKRITIEKNPLKIEDLKFIL
jgi:hypothetical protein